MEERYIRTLGALTEENKADGIDSLTHSCSSCLWGQGFAVCP